MPNRQKAIVFSTKGNKFNCDVIIDIAMTNDLNSNNFTFHELFLQEENHCLVPGYLCG